jgi:hypothetical protein
MTNAKGMPAWERKLKADLEEKLGELKAKRLAKAVGDALNAPTKREVNPHEFFRGKTHAAGMKAYQDAIGGRR